MSKIISKDNISNTTKTFAQKKKPMNAAVTAKEKQEIFKLIKSDAQVVEYFYNLLKENKPKEEANLTRSLTVKKMDLNADGQPEYVAVLNDVYFCGAHGNCPTWVYRKTGGEYNLLLSTGGQTLKLEKTSTEKFRDLRSSGSSSASEYNWTIYKFDGTTYKSDMCYSSVYTEGKKKPTVTSEKCKE